MQACLWQFHGNTACSWQHAGLTYQYRWIRQFSRVLATEGCQKPPLPLIPPWGDECLTFSLCLELPSSSQREGVEAYLVLGSPPLRGTSGPRCLLAFSVACSKQQSKARGEDLPCTQPSHTAWTSMQHAQGEGLIPHPAVPPLKEIAWWWWGVPEAGRLGWFGWGLKGS